MAIAFKEIAPKRKKLFIVTGLVVSYFCVVSMYDILIQNEWNILAITITLIGTPILIVWEENKEKEALGVS